MSVAITEKTITFPFTNGQVWKIDDETRLVKERDAFYLDQGIGGLIESVRLNDEEARTLFNILSEVL